MAIGGEVGSKEIFQKKCMEAGLEFVQVKPLTNMLSTITMQKPGYANLLGSQNLSHSSLYASAVIADEKYNQNSQEKPNVSLKI